MDYIIATMPRSGSNYLCELLARNGCGAPAEDFNIFAGISPFAAAFTRGSGTEDYLNDFIYKHRCVDGLFATKIMGNWLDIMKANMAMPCYTWAMMFDRLFPKAKVIFLTRKDRLKQAISWVKAQKTQAWRQTEDESSMDTTLDLRDIEQYLHSILLHEQKWREIFHECGIEPLHVVYEDYIKDPTPTLVAIGDLIGRKIEKPKILSKTCRVQTDHINQEAYETYLKHTLTRLRGKQEDFLAHTARIYS